MVKRRKKKKKKPKCLACNDTGLSSKGRICVACKGTSRIYQQDK